MNYNFFTRLLRRKLVCFYHISTYCSNRPKGSVKNERTLVFNHLLKKTHLRSYVRINVHIYYCKTCSFRHLHTLCRIWLEIVEIRTKNWMEFGEFCFMDPLPVPGFMYSSRFFYSVHFFTVCQIPLNSETGMLNRQKSKGYPPSFLIKLQNGKASKSWWGQFR
jgi:hypothetical protein